MEEGQIEGGGSEVPITWDSVGSVRLRLVLQLQGGVGSAVPRGPMSQVWVFSELVLYNYKFRWKTVRILKKTTQPIIISK